MAKFEKNQHKLMLIFLNFVWLKYIITYINKTQFRCLNIITKTFIIIKFKNRTHLEHVRSFFFHSEPTPEALALDFLHVYVSVAYNVIRIMDEKRKIKGCITFIE